MKRKILLFLSMFCLMILCINFKVSASTIVHNSDGNYSGGGSGSGGSSSITLPLRWEIRTTFLAEQTYLGVRMQIIHCQEIQI